MREKNQYSLNYWQLSIIALLAFCRTAMAVESPDSKKFNLENGVGLHGYDPVSYFMDKSPTEGKKELTTKDDNVTYRFASADHLEIFKKDPKKYEPRYGGWCAYAMATGDFVDVDPKKYKITDGKLLLFYNGFWGNTLEKWNKDETALHLKAETNWIKLFSGSR